jgi:cephalosporin hydroxylase
MSTERRRTLVVHDADHTAEAVLRDLRSYADLVSPGSYFIVEDGVVELFHPSASTRLGWSRPGPLTAAREFLREDDRFVADWRRERYVATYSPNGFLKRVK